MRKWSVDLLLTARLKNKLICLERLALLLKLPLEQVVPALNLSELEDKTYVDFQARIIRKVGNTLLTTFGLIGANISDALDKAKHPFNSYEILLMSACLAHLKSKTEACSIS